MFIVDAHQDIAYNYFFLGRDYQLSAFRKRELERETTHTGGIAMLGLPDNLLGRVAITFATLFAPPAANNTLSTGDYAYRTPQEAYKYASQQFDYYHRLADENEKIHLILTKKDLDDVLETWGEGKDIADHRQGLVILMEGADPIFEPQQFEEWYERGVRIVGPAWAGTRYSGGTGVPGPLTTLGHELLEVMASFNAILDLSHMAEEAYLEAVDQYEGVIIASHSNPRKFRTSDRHLSDVMIQRLAERDGVMGILVYNAFLSNQWRKGNPKSDLPFSIVLDAIDYVCQLTGSSAHVGIGSDFDGGFGAEATPEGFDTVSDLWAIGTGLRRRGYGENDIQAILGGNMVRKLRQGLPD